MKAVVISFAPEDRASLVSAYAGVESELARAGYDSIQRFEVSKLKLGFCQGEFDCWLRTPGRCKIHDAEQEITAAIPSADAMVFFGPTAFGGFCHQLKRAIDRTICLVSPFFEARNSLTHHSARYARIPKLFAVGWQAQRDTARQSTFEALNDAQAINFFSPGRGSLLVTAEWDTNAADAFRRLLAEPLVPGAAIDTREALRDELLTVSRPAAKTLRAVPRRASLLIGSAKPEGKSASECVALACERLLQDRGITCELHRANEFVHDDARTLATARAIAQSDLFLLCTPLYVDSLPSLVTHALELITQARGVIHADAAFMPFINCGFPEAAHNRTAVRILRHFAEDAGYWFAGALPLGGGGVIQPPQPLDVEQPPVAHVVRALRLTIPELATGRGVPAAALEAIVQPSLPGFAYRLMADLGFRWQAHLLGTRQRDLRAKPFA